MEQIGTCGTAPTARDTQRALCLGAALRIAGIALLSIPITACSVSIEPHPAFSSFKLPLKRSSAAPVVAPKITTPARVAASAPTASALKPAPAVTTVASTSTCGGTGCTATIQPEPIRWGGDSGGNGGGWGG